MIKVSVIVAVYNAEEYLRKCLDSLLGQTLKDIEIIMVDDGSTDSSADILAEYATKSAKFKCFSKTNGGAADARNFGFAHASGEYVGYVDSDDFVDSDMFESMYNKAKECGSDIVECNLHHTYPGGEDTETMVKYYAPGELLCFGRYVVWNKIYRREMLKEASAHFPVGLIYEDVAFIAKIVPYINGCEYIDTAPIHYTQRHNSVNNSKSLKTMDIFNILRDVKAFYEEKGFHKKYEHELEYLYARILLCSSLKRMFRIPDKSLRNKALALNYDELIKTYPKWRKNPILKQTRNRNAFFMKMQNPLVYKLICTIFPILLYIKNKFMHEWE